MTVFADLHRAVQSLTRRPWFSLVAIASLAFGIGANATVFTIVNALLFRPLPYPDSDRLVFIRAQNQPAGVMRGGVSLAELEAVRRGSPSLRVVGAFREDDFNVTLGERARRTRGAIVSAATLATLGAIPQLGGSFTDDDDRLGTVRRVLVSDELWRSALGGITDLARSRLRIDGEDFGVAGVMPVGFRFPERADFWLPVGASATGERSIDREVRSYQLVARLSPGATVKTARSELANLSGALDVERPKSDRGWTLTPIAAESERGETARPAVYLLFGLVTCVLLVTCANLASLLVVRAAGRRREMAIRSALGASHGRLVWHGLSESIVLAAIGMVGGIAFANLGVRGVRLAFPAETLPFWLSFHLDWRVVAYTLGTTGVVAIAFGLAPAVWSARRAPASGLVSGSRFATDTADRGKLGGLLVAGQVGVSLVLVVVASLLAAALRSMHTTDLGYEPRRLLTTGVEPRGQRYTSGDARRAYFVSLSERITAIPKVEGSTGFDLWGSAAVGVPHVGAPPEQIGAPLYTVMPGYFETLRVSVANGRTFGANDTFGTAAVAVVNATFARRYWPNESALGRRLRVPTSSRDTTWFTVVGVVGDVRRNPADLEWEPHVYVSALQFPPRRLQLIVRTRDGSVPARAMTDAARSIDPDEPLAPILTMDQQIGAWMAPARFFAAALAAFAVVAMLIAVAGVYGVVAGAVVARTREFGIRLALGATPPNVVALAMRRGARLSAVGAGVGLVGAIAVSQVLVTLPFGVEGVDARIVGVAALGLVAVALFAAYGPARRAGRVEPVVALSDDR